ncbi:transporter substrate-binding domain-containing protein [Marinobacter sp. CHS3-4]|uniref:transporter substrate-binding domain-containing protein n=1 Tax=Marinobacter sp. CHS3-4 TaxID=3045174 RepID=UPI0024B587FD|nr:transporter substrate-binding domain-containing protein [Marinobacter sp. CHS3-4]MDI9246564.1 transporter substrate-binding domain-containing protein [Marinobacter sp. CHS3-4]
MSSGLGLYGSLGRDSAFRQFSVWVCLIEGEIFEKACNTVARRSYETSPRASQMTSIDIRQMPRRAGSVPAVVVLTAVVWLICCLVPVSVKAVEHIRIAAPDLPGASGEGGTGRDAEIVDQVLNLCGYQAEFVVQPFGRHLRTYREQQNYDAAMTVPLAANLAGAGTAAYIWYQNGAYYDSSRTGPIRSIEDLSDLHLVTFKNGVELLELNEIVPDIASVLEIADQRVHSKLLFLKRVDAILADGLIIAEINRRLANDQQFSPNFDPHAALRFSPIFPPSPYKMVFRDSLIAEEFDRCYDAARKDGVIADINERHLGPFQHELRHGYLGF